MKSYYRFLTLAFAAFASVSVAAQTDVTTEYLTNPSFEADASACTDGVKVIANQTELRGWNLSSYSGWTVNKPNPGTQLLITADCFTDNNFGKTSIPDGTYAFYQRVGWDNATSAISQSSLKALAAGSYKLTFKSKAFHKNDNNTGTVKAQILSNGDKGSTSFTFDKGSDNCMTSSQWAERSILFTLTEAATITVKIDVTFLSGGSQVALDDFRLISLPDNYEEPKEPAIIGGKETDVESPTEGVITHAFVSEADMMQDLLQMLTNHLTYMKSLYTPCVSPNSKGEDCGFFKDTEGSNNDEKVVRPNADFSMICAFLYKYARNKTALPAGITWDDVKEMAVKSLIWGYSSHNANKFKTTSRQQYWGSTSTSQSTWESSLWAMSLAYSAHFLKDELSADQQTYIYNMIKAECNYELQRNIPTGYSGDTKAEENGWEADILACALGLYPDDELAPQWFARLREFAINSYSQADDANDPTVIDPDYDQKTVADLYKGQNLYDDYTLQNHNLFHTSYQNVVQQELGEAYLAMLLFQGDTQKWHTNALMHNQQHVMDEVLNRLALADGELAMPNGNDWSLFLFDQITSYSTMACFLRDPNALLLENMAYKFIKARQQTTTDGSWLLRSDVGSRRMGVEAHRVMMTYLMHAAASTADLTPSTWAAFSEKYQDAHLFTTQNIVRASSNDRFVTFSWSSGLKSYTGYFTDTTPDRNKIICPYRANNTGNILGWYNVAGKGTNASPVVSGIYDLQGNAFTMNGRINTNDAALENSFVLAATPGNALIYMSHVKGLQSGTLTGRRGGLLAVTTDPFTRPQRTLYHASGRVQTDGTKLTQIESSWANIDNSIGIVTLGGTGSMAFGEQANNNSILCSKFYPLYSNEAEAFTAGQVIDRPTVIYYSRVDSAATQALSAQAIDLTPTLAQGWSGVICADPDSTRYLVLANLRATTNRVQLQDISLSLGAPVLPVETTIIDGKASATVPVDADHAHMSRLSVFVSGADVYAKAFNPADESQVSLRAIGSQKQSATVTYLHEGKTYRVTQDIEPEGTYLVRFDNNELTMTLQEKEEEPAPAKLEDITDRYLTNTGFEEDETWATTGNITLNGIAYNPCYTQSVAAANSNFPQVLPVKGWTAETALSPSSKFCLLYSMPYSFTQYCVSPSDIGNSASIMSVPAAYADSARTRCLSILNSWTAGTNAVSQTVKLPKGSYLATWDMLYVCPNESRHTGANVITSTSGNVNTSLCGVAYGGSELYAVPALANRWEELTIPFELTEDTDVTFRLGLRTSKGEGAANNTRLYVDNLRLYGLTADEPEPLPVGITAPAPVQAPAPPLYDLSGRRLTSPLRQGIYIAGKRKVARQ